MMALFPRIATLCSARDSKKICRDRLEAVKAGRFYPDFSLGGWVDKDTPLHYMTERVWQAVYMERKDYEHKDLTGKPFLWDLCPWCHQPLPEVSKKLKRVVDRERDE